MIWRVLFCVFIMVGVVCGQTVYYINDDSTDDDVYTTAPGSDANDGLSPATPMRTLPHLLASYTLGPGDVVYIDAGLYENYTSTINASGNADNPIVFQGAPTQGGTVFRRNSTRHDVFVVIGSHIHFNNLTVENGRIGFQIQSANNLVIRDSVIRTQSHSAIFRGGVHVIRTIIANVSSVVSAVSGGPHSFDRCVFWGNERTHNQDDRNWSIHNSVIEGGEITGNMLGDFNVFYDIQNISYGLALNQPNSVVGNPGFMDPASWNFRPQTNSILIDFGDPAMSVGDEPMPNGGRINAGIFGGTTNAVTSPTTPWLRALTFNDGGAVTGAVQSLVWNGGAFAPGATVRVQYSSNAGATWTDIQTGVPVTNRVVNWDVSGEPPMAAFWRVVSEADPTVVSVSGQRFSVNEAKVLFYVNDASTDGNVYTTAVGSDLNDGLTPATPMASLANLFATYNFGGHDIVYVDTGVYSGNVFMSVGTGGSAALGDLTIQGSPHGTEFVNSNEVVFSVLGSRIDFRDFIVRDSAAGLTWRGSPDLRFRRVTFRNNQHGIRHIAGGGSGIFEFYNCLFANNSSGVHLLNANTHGFTFYNCVGWNNGTFFHHGHPGGNNRAFNSIIVGGLVDPPNFNVLRGYYSVHWDNQWNAGSPSFVSEVDPLFHDPEHLDFHLQSGMGRWNSDLQEWETDSVHSPLIDAGDPTFSVGDEPEPHGDRINIGLYGGTPFASKSYAPYPVYPPAEILPPRVAFFDFEWTQRDAAEAYAVYLGFSPSEMVYIATTANTSITIDPRIFPHERGDRLYWLVRPIEDGNLLESPVFPSAFLSFAVGADAYYDAGGYRYLVWSDWVRNSSESSWYPDYDTVLDILVVAGGGAGGSAGSFGGGGGGAGGVLVTERVAATSQNRFHIVVGDGGVPGSHNDGDTAFNGENTTVANADIQLELIAVGGGVGGRHTVRGQPGGSGGGGSGRSDPVPGVGIPGQGHDGGAGITSYAGGGGGAGAVGTGGVSGQAGHGGAGLDFSGWLNGAPLGDQGWFAGGGAAGRRATSGYGPAAVGGIGGGGNENQVGTANTGGGGGGGVGNAAGRAGGSGIVIIRYGLGPGFYPSFQQIRAARTPFVWEPVDDADSYSLFTGVDFDNLTYVGTTEDTTFTFDFRDFVPGVSGVAYWRVDSHEGGVTTEGLVSGYTYLLSSVGTNLPITRPISPQYEGNELPALRPEWEPRFPDPNPET